LKGVAAKENLGKGEKIAGIKENLNRIHPHRRGVIVDQVVELLLEHIQGHRKRWWGCCNGKKSRGMVVGRAQIWGEVESS